MRCSFSSSTRSARWPFATVEVDDDGLVVRGRRGRLAAVRWHEVRAVVRCGYTIRANVRVVPEDGPRFVVGGPKVVREVAAHLPERLALRTERRRWYPWIPDDAGSSVRDRWSR